MESGTPYIMVMDVKSSQLPEYVFINILSFFALSALIFRSNFLKFPIYHPEL